MSTSGWCRHHGHCPPTASSTCPASTVSRCVRLLRQDEGWRGVELKGRVRQKSHSWLPDPGYGFKRRGLWTQGSVFSSFTWLLVARSIGLACVRAHERACARAKARAFMWLSLSTLSLTHLMLSGSASLLALHSSGVGSPWRFRMQSDFSQAAGHIITRSNERSLSTYLSFMAGSPVPVHVVIVSVAQQ
jgi:hypothetical protein